MFGDRSSARLGLGALFLAGLSTTACGYSEDEWQQKLREIERLNTQLTAEQDQSSKARQDTDEARAQVEQLKQQLRASGVDISNLNANLEQQARALEDYKRRAEQLEAIKKRFETLRNKLQALTKLGLKVTVRNNRMVIQLPGDVLFDSGRTSLKKGGTDILAKVAEVVRNDPALAARNFQVAGHTDSAPMGGGPYKDNWGLSVMRAREVLVYLVTPVDMKGGGLSDKRWSAAGYGEMDPVKPNDTPVNKQSNRRVELVVLPNVEEMLDLKALTK